MHEVSLVQALFDQADHAIRPHPSAAVRQVTVCIGSLAGVECALFRSAFEGCKDERGYANAALQLLEVQAAWRCGECGASLADSDPSVCPSCGGTPTLSAGGELILQRLELETSDV